jgi:hypothetical protein
LLDKEKNEVLDHYITEGNNEKLVVKTPIEFGATNWILLVEFREARVSALKVRTEKKRRN